MLGLTCFNWGRQLGMMEWQLAYLGSRGKINKIYCLKENLQAQNACLTFSSNAWVVSNMVVLEFLPILGRRDSY